MKLIRAGRMAVFAVLACGQAAFAAESGEQVVLPSAEPPLEAQAPLPISLADCHCTVVPALTPVEIEILAPVGSKTSKNGDTFPIRLAKAVVIDGREVLPAGLTGMGEVVHAKPSGGGGGAGELVLAARYLQMPNGRVRLRSLHVGSVGKDQTGLAMATAMAVGIIGMVVKGKNTEIAAGTLAEAKIAEDVAVATPAGGPSPAVPDVAVAGSTVSVPSTATANTSH